MDRAQAVPSATAGLQKLFVEKACNKLIDSSHADKHKKWLNRVSKDYVNCQDDQGRTLLCTAAKEGRYVALQHLCKILDADVNLADSTGNTPIKHAVENNRYNSVAFLLGAKARVTDNELDMAWTDKMRMRLKKALDDQAGKGRKRRRAEIPQGQSKRARREIEQARAARREDGHTDEVVERLLRISGALDENANRPVQVTQGENDEHDGAAIPELRTAAQNANPFEFDANARSTR